MDKMREEKIQIIPLSHSIRASVIVPFFYAERAKNLEGLMADFKGQTFQGMELIIVSGVSPQGRAINQGVRVSRGEVLMVVDDDSRLGNSRVVENLLRALDAGPSCAMVGASILTPEDANSFQKMIAKQFPRFNMPVVKEITDSDMPCHGCAAFRKDVFMAVGMERENIIRGLDPDLRVRIRKAGYRVVLAPDTWAYHPLPPTFGKLMRLFTRNGFGSAYAQIFHPELNYDTDEKIKLDGFVPKRTFLYRALRYPIRMLKSLLTFQWVKLFAYLAYLVGYAQGYFYFSFTRRKV
mgnify:CR=1 FL=1